MKIALGRLVPALMIGALVLQGCASTGTTQTRGQGPMAPQASSVAIPEVDNKPVVKAASRADFDALAAAIRQQLLPGGRWQYTDQNERDTINQTLDDMAKLYQQFGTVAKMDNAATIKLQADRNTINPILAKKDGERLICADVVHVGTHLPVRTCMTYAQVQRKLHGSQQGVRDFYQQRNHVPNTNNGLGQPAGSH